MSIFHDSKNVTYNKFDPTSPFCGYKESGFGREGGLQWLAAYCRAE